MKILVLNQGSSSLKCALYEFNRHPSSVIQPIWENHLTWDSKEPKETQLHKALLACLTEHRIDCIGHRVVQGGAKYQKSTLIDRAVKQEVLRLADLAPLHNVLDVEGMEILEKLLPNTPQIAVFDSAFHHTMPLYASTYPGPYAWKEMGIQRFGFHGISYQYCAQRAKEVLQKEIENMVICHLGAGASLCAVKRGKSIDTTMGLTPLEGLMMDTRSGTVDPGILLYLLQKKGKTCEQISTEMYTQSGLLGISGAGSDMKTVIKQAEQGHTRAQLALDMYIHRLNGLIGSMIASLGGIDALVFTGGIGENSTKIRERSCLAFQFLGVRLTPPLQEYPQDTIISTKDSKVDVLLLHTQEAFEIGRECWNLMHTKH